MKSISERVYANLLKVPKGRVTTYKELAKSVGMENGQRAIGRIMNRNPSPIAVPCHRVVRSDGKVGGYAYGEETKTSLLSKEGVRIRDGRLVDWEKVFFRMRGPLSRATESSPSEICPPLRPQR